MPSREQERRDLESTDPQPGSSTFDRAWEAANGARVLSIDERARAMPRELRDRQVSVRAGDTVTANYLIHAAFLIEEMRAELCRMNDALVVSKGKLDLAIHELRERQKHQCWDHAMSIGKADLVTAKQYAEKRGWDCFKEDGHAR